MENTDNYKQFGRRETITEAEAKLLISETLKEFKVEIADECAIRIQASSKDCYASGLFRSDKDVYNFRQAMNIMENHILSHKEYNITKEKRNNRVWWIVGVLVSVFGLAIIKIIIQLSYLSNIQLVSK